ncbi:MAG: hypothetical protein N2049_07695 [Anaerolineales bacterium]|nr:hypothetical protein [Anaerolineales bacterium]MCX7609083.1 hypothetical protein [Anaerolineales bacterium]MDW8226828.1 hypothetical protein [Anaerolineales bacterium]
MGKRFLFSLVRALAALSLFFSSLSVILLLAGGSTRAVFAQQPTGSIPTVTGTPLGPTVKVYADRNIIEVYAGPDAYLYPPVGILLAGEEAPALGFSPDRTWIKIVYLGAPGGTAWVYAPYVALLRSVDLPVLEAPPTATPRVTPTIDPTAAALYGLQVTPQRPATFTPPPPLEIPSFETASGLRPGLPSGLLIFLLALIGGLGVLVSFLRGSR